MVLKWLPQGIVMNPIICTNWGRLLPQSEKGLLLWWPMLMTPICYGTSVSVIPTLDLYDI
jgi:hypothetical protein